MWGTEGDGANAACIAQISFHVENTDESDPYTSHNSFIRRCRLNKNKNYGQYTPSGFLHEEIGRAVDLLFFEGDLVATLEGSRQRRKFHRKVWNR